MAQQYGHFVYKVGDKFHDVEVVAVRKESYSVRCKCGKVLVKKNAQPRPMACSTCFKARQADAFSVGKQDHDPLGIREYTADEKLMIKDFNARRRAEKQTK